MRTARWLISLGAGLVFAAVTGLAVTPVITQQPNGSGAPTGQTMTFNVTATGALGYQWYQQDSITLVNTKLVDGASSYKGENISGATTSSLTIANLPLSASGDIITVVVSNGANTVTSNGSSNMTVFDEAVFIDTDLFANKSVMAGGSVSYVFVVGGGPLPTFQWRKGGVNLSSGLQASGSTISLASTFDAVSQDTSSTLTITHARSGDAGNYDVVATNTTSGPTTVNHVTSTARKLTVIPLLDDFDGDARSDVLWRNFTTFLIGSWTSGAGFKGYGSETGNWAVIGTGDFDGDGKVDVLWHNTSTHSVASWTSSGAFMTFGTEGGGWAVIGTGDFDGDGKTDVLWHNTNTFVVASWTSGAGYKSFGAESGGWAVIKTGDFDGDGKSDVLWHNTSTGLVASWTSGAGYKSFGVESSGWAVIATGDFDGDHVFDVLWHNTNTGLVASWASGGSFMTFGTEGGGWAALNAGDFDGDGKFDVLWHNTNTGLVASWESTAGYVTFGTEGIHWTVIE